MSFLDKYRRKEKIENKTTDKKPEELKLDPFVEDYLELDHRSGDYDGNKAFEREKWLETADLSALNMLRDLHKLGKENSPLDKKSRERFAKRYSKENIIRALSVLEDFKENHDFSLGYVSGKIKKTRFNLFPPTIREKITNDIVDGKLTDFDEAYFTVILSRGKKSLEEIGRAVRAKKEKRRQREERKQERLSKFKETANAHEPLNTEGPLLVIETHAGGSFARALEETKDALPENLSPQLLRIKYQEGTSAAEKERQAGETAAYQEDYNEITDRSGGIGDKFLKRIAKEGEKANFILTGGNLRGCLSSSLESIVESIRNNRPAQADIHIPLDKTYDNASYDDIALSKFPTDFLKAKSGIYTEIYKDGELIDLSPAEKEEHDIRVRLYLWSKLEILSEKLKNAAELKKIREKISEMQ